MAHTKKKVFDGLYAQLEETDGNVVLFSAKGEPSVIFEMTNPVQQLCTDACVMIKQVRISVNSRPSK